MLHASCWIAIVAGLAYAVAVLGGVPALRQDWGSFPFGETWKAVLASGVNGWSPDGIGAPRPYPSSFLLSIPIAALTAVAGSHLTLLCYVGCIGLIAAFGARAFAFDFGAGEIAASAAAVFAVFNPWAYTELVAGHTSMLLAYAASIWLFREALRPQPRVAALAFWALLTAQQLQFFLVSTAALGAIAAIYGTWLPLALAGVVWLPSVIGVVADRHALDAIPFLLAWERNQSVRFGDALQLNGYFAGYGTAFAGYFKVGTLATLALAVLGVFAADRRRVLLAAGSLVAIVAATGSVGPLAAVFNWLVLHARGIALYRELYDVVAFAAIGYMALAAALCARVRAAGWIWLAATLVLVVAWVRTPPARHWVWLGDVPHVAIHASPNERFALVPEFQPMDFRGRGSGTDPDAYPRDANVTPVNEYVASYPVDAALGAFAQNGDARALEALSVATVVPRPWLHPNYGDLAEQWAFASTWRHRPYGPALTLHAAPELSIGAMPLVGTLDTNIGSADVFYADAAAARGPGVPPSWSHLTRIGTVLPTTSETDPSLGWIDARLAFEVRPDLAQPFGGALTTDSTALLPVEATADILALVRGALRTQSGALVARTTHGYRWLRLPPGARDLVCDGLCVVAAQGDPPSAPLEPAARPGRAVPFVQSASWLAFATIPPTSAGALRYNVAYDPGWAAYLGGRRLTHVRLDAATNGWLLPATDRDEPLVLLHVPSVAQLAAEVLAIIVIWAAAARLLLSRERTGKRRIGA